MVTVMVKGPAIVMWVRKLALHAVHFGNIVVNIVVMIKKDYLQQ